MFSEFGSTDCINHNLVTMADIHTYLEVPHGEMLKFTLSFNQELNTVNGAVKCLCPQKPDR